MSVSKEGCQEDRDHYEQTNSVTNIEDQRDHWTN